MMTTKKRNVREVWTTDTETCFEAFMRGRAMHADIELIAGGVKGKGSAKVSGKILKLDFEDSDYNRIILSGEIVKMAQTGKIIRFAIRLDCGRLTVAKVRI